MPQGYDAYGTFPAEEYFAQPKRSIFDMLGIKDFGDLLPYIVGIGGAIAGQPYLAAAGLGWGALQRDTDASNVHAEELEEDFLGGVRDVRGGIREIEEDLPSFTAGGQTFGGGGKGPHFDLDAAFHAPAEAQRDYFREFYPDTGISPVDFGLEDIQERSRDLFDLAGTNISNIPFAVGSAFDASSARLKGLAEEGGLGVTGEDLLFGVDLPSTDLSDIREARLAGSAAVSGERERLQRQNLSTLAQDVGGLENLRRRSESLGFEEAGRRGLEASGIVGQTRMEELDAQKFVSNLQAGAGFKAADINQMLASGLMAGERERGMTEAQAAITSAVASGELSAAEASNLINQGTLAAREGETNVDVAKTNAENALTEYFTGLESETAVPKAEFSSFLTGLDQYLRQSGQREGLAALDLNAVLGQGQITSPQMIRQIIDGFSAMLGMKNVFDPPRGPSRPESYGLGVGPIDFQYSG